MNFFLLPIAGLVCLVVISNYQETHEREKKEAAYYFGRSREYENDEKYLEKTQQNVRIWPEPLYYNLPPSIDIKDYSNYKKNRPYYNLNSYAYTPDKTFRNKCECVFLGEPGDVIYGEALRRGKKRNYFGVTSDGSQYVRVQATKNYFTTEFSYICDDYLLDILVAVDELSYRYEGRYRNSSLIEALKDYQESFVKEIKCSR